MANTLKKNYPRRQNDLGRLFFPLTISPHLPRPPPLPLPLPPPPPLPCPLLPAPLPPRRQAPHPERPRLVPLPPPPPPPRLRRPPQERPPPPRPRSPSLFLLPLLSPRQEVSQTHRHTRNPISLSCLLSGNSKEKLSFLLSFPYETKEPITTKTGPSRRNWFVGGEGAKENRAELLGVERGGGGGRGRGIMVVGEEAALEEDVGVVEVAEEKGEGGVEVALGVELAVGEGGELAGEGKGEEATEGEGDGVRP